MTDPHDNYYSATYPPEQQARIEKHGPDLLDVLQDTLDVVEKLQVSDRDLKVRNDTCRMAYEAYKAFLAAYARGATARAQGVPITHNPYKDLRTDGGSVTFARAFMRYWTHGWEDGHNED